MTLKIISLSACEIRDTGLFKVDLNKLPLPSNFVCKDHVLISLPPKQIGGNHKHPRREIFFSLSDSLEFYWEDEDKKIHSSPMKQGNKLYLIDVYPYVPHAVVNRSDKEAMLIEFADSHQYDVIRHIIVS